MIAELHHAAGVVLLLEVDGVHQPTLDAQCQVAFGVTVLRISAVGRLH